MGKSLRDREGGVVLNGDESVSAPHHPLRRRIERPQVAITPEYIRSLYLTSRDWAIIRLLAEVNYLTVEQVAQLFWSHVKSPCKGARDRLRELYIQHVLDHKPGVTLPQYGIKLQLVYSLGRAGVDLIREESTSKARSSRHSGGLLLAHNVLLAQVMVDLQSALRQRHLDWHLLFYGEREISTAFSWGERWVRMRPDAYLVVQADSREIPFFVEMDTGKRPVDHYLTKVSQYEMFFSSSAWRQEFANFPAVLTVVWAPTMSDSNRYDLADRRLHQIVDLIQEHRKEAGVRWFFCNWQDVGSGEWRLLNKNGQLQNANLFRAANQGKA